MERPQAPPRDERAGRGHEIVKTRRLRSVEIEQHKIAGLVEQNRIAAFKILPATAALEKSHQHLPGGAAIDLAARAPELKTGRQKVRHAGVAERPDMEPRAKVIRLEARMARVMRGQRRGHHRVEKVSGAPAGMHAFRIDQQGHGDLTN